MRQPRRKSINGEALVIVWAQSANHVGCDSVLLNGLAEANVGGYTKEWKQAAGKRWSKFGSDDYEQVIALIRHSLKGAPLWKVEEYWKGNQ